jgi:hypothetical protein
LGEPGPKTRVICRDMFPDKPIASPAKSLALAN